MKVVRASRGSAVFAALDVIGLSSLACTGQSTRTTSNYYRAATRHMDAATDFASYHISLAGKHARESQDRD